MKKLFFITVLAMMTSVHCYAVSIGAYSNMSANFMLVEQTGQRTGYDPGVRGVVFESNSPTLTYYINALGGDETSYMLQGKLPVEMMPLNMKLVVTGMQLTANNKIVFTLRENKSGLKYPQNSVYMILTPILDVGQVVTYNLAYTPLKSIIATKIAVPTDLIADITTAQKLNLIGNTKFIAELTKEINEIESEKAKGKADDGLTPAQKAKKEYTELLSEITEKYNKPESDEFVKQEAYTVLREDIEYIIGHM